MSHVATVTIDNTKVSGSSNHSGFPVLVDLSDLPSSFWDVVVDGGGDIRVYEDDDTTELPREVVDCDTADDTGELWVRLNTLNYNSDTVIHIYADGTSSEPASDSTYGSENVWQDYEVVSHDGGINDSTGNGYLTNSGVAATTGKIGGAGTFATTDYVSIANAVGSVLGEVTIQWWMKATQSTEGDPLYGRNSTNSQITAMQYNRSGTAGAVRLFWRDSDSNGIDAIVSSPSTNWRDGSWHLQHHVIDGPNNTWGFYIDGSAETPSYSAQNTPDNFTVQNSFMYGRRSDVAQDYFSSDMDESRIRGSLLSADWISTEKNNQDSPSTFYTATAPAAGGGGAFSQAVVIM